MREILFRGQTRKRGQKVNMAGDKLPGMWVYGGIFPGTGDYSVIYGGDSEEATVSVLDKHIVYSETVGQYTGLTDKNGKKIFEGDMVVSYDVFGYEAGCGIVNWNDLFVAWHIGEKSMYGNSIAAYEVIGNIHDNPVLLKNGRNDNGMQILR